MRRNVRGESLQRFSTQVRQHTPSTRSGQWPRKNFCLMVIGFIVLGGGLLLVLDLISLEHQVKRHREHEKEDHAHMKIVTAQQSPFHPLLPRKVSTIGLPAHGMRNVEHMAVDSESQSDSFLASVRDDDEDDDDDTDDESLLSDDADIDDESQTIESETGEATPAVASEMASLAASEAALEESDDTHHNSGQSTTPELKAYWDAFDTRIGPPGNRPHNSGDWWQFNEVFPPQNNRQISESSIAVARKKWYKEEVKDKDSDLTRFSRPLDENYCVQWKTYPETQWQPPPEALCNWTNTAIFWHSMHGTMAGRDFRDAETGKHWMWDYAVELEKNKMCTCPSNVAFVFADNQVKDLRLIQRSYKMCNDNCNFFHISRDYNPWDWYGKIGPLHQLIADPDFQAKFQYVVLTDADDQTLSRSPHDIIERFEFYDADIVVAGEATSYPHWMRAESNAENKRAPWSAHHQHLNAGGFMAKVKALIPYLEEAKIDYQKFTKENEEVIKETGRNRWRDQTWLRQAHLEHYPKIKIDSLVKLWSRVDIYVNDL